MFTSLFKTGLLKEQIRVLNGFEYFDRMEGIIAKVRETLSREREMLEIIVSDEENFFQEVIFWFTLALETLLLYPYRHPCGRCSTGWLHPSSGS